MNKKGRFDTVLFVKVALRTLQRNDDIRCCCWFAKALRLVKVKQSTTKQSYYHIHR